MHHDIIHGERGPEIVFTLPADEARAIHDDLHTTLHTSGEFDEFDAELNTALRLVYGRSYRKGAN